MSTVAKSLRATIVRSGSKTSQKPFSSSFHRPSPLSRQVLHPPAAHSLFLSYRRAMSSSIQVPETMKAVICTGTGGVEVLDHQTDVKVPQPKEGELLVKNDFIGINYIDTYFRTGLYPAPKPEILGREGEGTVVAVGPESSSASLQGLKVGDRVVWMATGGYAEYTAVPAKSAVKITEGFPEKNAVAALLQGLTALTMIRESHHVQKGEWVLVHAAAGGVGLWLCQLVKAVGGRVIGTASTEEKCEVAKQNGAEHVINYSGKSQEELKTEILKLTDDQGCHAIFDGVGKDTFELDLEVVRRKGTLVSFGNASGPVPPFSISRLTGKNAKLLRPTLFNYLATREEFETYTSELFDIIEKEKINIKIHEVYPLQEVARAHQDLEGRKTLGKLLLKP